MLENTECHTVDWYSDQENTSIPLIPKKTHPFASNSIHLLHPMFSLAFFVLIVVLHLSILCCYSSYSIYTTAGQPLYRLLVQKSTYNNSNHDHNDHKPQHGFKNEQPKVYEHIELMWNAELNRDILVVFRREDNGLVAVVLLLWHKTLKLNILILMICMVEICERGRETMYPSQMFTLWTKVLWRIWILPFNMIKKVTLLIMKKVTNPTYIQEIL